LRRIWLVGGIGVCCRMVRMIPMLIEELYS
jgi:hypothetical protein